MTSAREVVRAEATPDDLAAWMTRANSRVFRHSAKDQFVTLFCAVLAPTHRDIPFVSAGHPQAFLFGPSGVRSLRATGPPLGVFEQTRYQTETVQPTPGDLLVVYSDGITEAHTPRDAFFGEHGIREVVERLSHRPPAVIAEGLCDAARRFEVNNADEADDKAVVVVRVTDPPETATTRRPRRGIAASEG